MLNAFITLARAFWSMSLLRLGPQDVPRSHVLLGLVTGLNLLVSVAINRLQLELPAAFLVALLELTVLGGLTSTLLYYFRRLPRLAQTLTAFMGTGAVVGLLVLVVLTVFPRIPQLLRLAIFAWNLLIMAHILRHALGIHLLAGFLIALGYAITLVQLIWFVDGLLGVAP